MVSNSWTILLRCSLLIALLTVAACQTAPVQEMSDARQAIAVAKEAGAADHAAADLRDAENYLVSAERSLDQREYSQARRDALQAKTRALDALRVSQASKDKDND